MFKLLSPLLATLLLILSAADASVQFAVENKGRHMYKLGWVRDTPDARDVYFKLPEEIPSIPYVRLPDYGIPIFVQNRLGSCVAQSVAFADEYVMFKNNNKWKFRPSRLHIYYEARALIGTILVDSGSQIRDGFKVINKIGVCPEYMWSYSDDQIRFRLRPPKKAYDSAKLHKSIAYARVPQTEAGIKSTLISGYPVVFGFMVYESFMSDKTAQTGVMTMPDLSKENAMGGHAVVCIGYDNANKVYICRNSWGSWGDKGYFYMPFEYLHNPDLASDLWTLYSSN